MSEACGCTSQMSYREVLPRYGACFPGAESGSGPAPGGPPFHWTEQSEALCWPEHIKLAILCGRVSEKQSTM